MNLQEVECGDIDWIGVARDRDMWRSFVNVVVNIWVQYIAGNLLNGCRFVSLCGWTELDPASWLVR